MYLPGSGANTPLELVDYYGPWTKHEQNSVTNRSTNALLITRIHGAERKCLPA